VVLAAYNEAVYLPTQLWALTHQDRPADEYIFLNDGSTDDTGALLRGVPGPNVTILTRPAPSGPECAVNAAASRAAGDWLYIASANDVVQPGAFAAWAAALRDHPDAVLMAGDLAHLALGWRPGTGALPPSQLVGKWEHGHIIHGAGVFIRRDAFGLGYDPTLEWLADWWLYHTTALRHGLVYLAQPIAAVRSLPGSHSHSYQDAGRLARVVARVAALLDAPDTADIRAAFLRTGLLDIPEAGSGAVRGLLAEAVPA
jgi:glycosyltransferase involved in cell wall biosynthesis